MGILFTHNSEHLTTVRATGTVRLNEIAEMGRVGTGTVSLEDTAGTLAIIGHKAFRVTESDCSQPKTFRGFVVDRRIRRDTRRTGAERIIDVDLLDLNARLGFKVLRGSAWRKRPNNETVGDRLTDLLASGFFNVEDNGFVTYDSTQLDGGDLRGQRPGDVLMDMATKVGFNFFLYWDESADEVSLWFGDSNTSTDWTSTLRVSNVPSDLDTATAAAFLTGTTFGASDDTELRRSPQQTVSGVWLPFRRGNVYRTRAATETTYEPRDGTAPNANVNRRSRARSLADAFLFDHREEEDRIITTIQVPSSKVNLARAGQRISCRFSHFAEEGYGEFSWFRILERTVVLPVPDDDIYNLQLVLSPQEAGCSVEPTFVQHRYTDSADDDDPMTPNFTYRFSFTSTTAPGDVILVALTHNHVIEATPAGWTAIIENVNTQADNGGAWCSLYWKESEGESYIDIQFASNIINVRVDMDEYAGLTNPVQSGSSVLEREDPNAGSATQGNIAFPAGPALVVGYLFTDDGPQGADSLAISGTANLRSSIAGGLHGSGEVGHADRLLDTSAGNASWTWLNTGTLGANYLVGLVFVGDNC